MESLLKRLQGLESEITLSLEEAITFIKLLEDYQSQLDSIQQELLKNKGRIEEGIYNQEIQESIEKCLDALKSLTSDEMKARIKNRYDVLLNFENYAQSENDEISLEFIRQKLGSFQKLIN